MKELDDVVEYNRRRWSRASVDIDNPMLQKVFLIAQKYVRNCSKQKLRLWMLVVVVASK